MYVRVVLQQQAQTANQANPRPAERPERAERPEQPERPEPQERNSPLSGDEIRAQIRSAIQAAQEASADARAARGPNGFPVIAGGAQTHIGVPPQQQDMIPPQAVDIAIGFFVMCAVMVIGWPLARAFGRRLERGGASAAVPVGMQEQLQRIEQAVDAMSIEIERISESQRFLTKLQSGAASEAATLEAGERR